MEDIFKVIFQLDSDAKGAIEGLNKVNAKYVETNDSLKKQQDQLKKLQAEEAKLLQGRSKSNNPTAIVKYNTELIKNQTEIRKVTQEINKLTSAEKQGVDATKQYADNLNKAFDSTKAAALGNELKKISTENKAMASTSKDAFGQLKVELKQAKAELLEAFGSGNQAQIQKASKRVGEIKDQMNDLNEATSAFASGSKFQVAGNLGRNVLGDLVNFDFDGARQKSQALLAVTKSMTFKEALGGVKDLGATLLNVGKSLLMNPIFLIGTAVTLIISNFDKLKSSGGLVGKVFTFIGDTISGVIEGFTRLTDAMGLTEIAVEKLRVRQLEKLRSDLAQITELNDKRINIAKAQGKETEKLEKERLETIIDYGLRESAALRERFNTLSSEEKDRLKELGKVIGDSRNQIAVIEAAANKRRADEAKKAADERKRKAQEEEEALFQQLIKNQDAIDDQYTARYAKEKADAKKAEEERKKAAEEAQAARQKEEEELFQMLIKNEDAKDDQFTRRNNKEKADAKKAEEERKARVQQQLNDIQTITNAVIDGAQQQLDAEIRKIDQLTQLQEKRVEDAKEIADKGNAELLELEQDRLNQLNEQKQKFVRDQQALALIEMAANSAIAITKAAAQGGAAAPVTIAATLIALIAGLAQARSIASQGFYDGGYTGDGNPREESRQLGKRPYTYHKAEFVFNHEKTAKYKDIFQDIHKGNIDLAEWRNKVNAYEGLKLMAGLSARDNSINLKSLEEKLDTVVMAIQGQSTSINLDEHGLSARFQNIKSRNDFIKNKVARL